MLQYFVYYKGMMRLVQYAYYSLEKFYIIMLLWFIKTD